MAVYRSALGKSVDMSALVARNEKTRAVGNMKVNARGDTIDSTGKVIQPVTSKVSDRYNKTVGNRSAQIVKKPTQSNTPVPPAPPKPAVEEPLTEWEKEIEESFEDDVEVEKIKAKETKRT